MPITEDELILYHHGIKGQRWGVRRYQNEDGSLTDAGKRHMNPNKALKKMSNKELAEINERLALESRYKDLRAKESARGRKAAFTALKVIGAVGVGMLKSGIVTKDQVNAYTNNIIQRMMKKS